MTTTSAPHVAPVRLNLGCGNHKLPDFTNVDLYGEPDIRLDLESPDWPWADSSVDLILLNHVLEHLGRDFDIFNRVIKNIYRVCKSGANVIINVPHPRHDNFIGDPTHVRIVTPQVMSLYDKAQCEAWQAGGYSNTPLALYHRVDFRMIECVFVPDRAYEKLPPQDLEALARQQNNVIVEIRMQFEVRK